MSTPATKPPTAGSQEPAPAEFVPCPTPDCPWGAGHGEPCAALVDVGSVSQLEEMRRDVRSLLARSDLHVCAAIGLRSTRRPDLALLDLGQASRLLGEAYAAVDKVKCAMGQPVARRATTRQATPGDFEAAAEAAIFFAQEGSLSISFAAGNIARGRKDLAILELGEAARRLRSALDWAEGAKRQLEMPVDARAARRCGEIGGGR